MRVIDQTVRRLDDLPVTGALQRRLGRVLRRDQMHVGMQLVGPLDAARAGHRHRMVVARAALGDGQVVPAVALVEVRSLDQPVRAAGEDIGDRADEPARARVVFLQQDSGEGRVPPVPRRSVRAVVPDHVDEPFAAVVVVEEGRVEAARIHIGRVGPRALDRRRGDDVIVSVLEVAVEAFHVGVDEPEPAVGVRQAGRPDPAGIGIAAHVELRRAIERTLDEAPVHEIARVMDLDARIPLEGGGRDVIVLADPADRRVGIEARQDRIADRGHLASSRRVSA